VAIVAARPARAQNSSDAGWRDVNLDGYRGHLEKLEGVVSDCAQQRKFKTAMPAADNACNPDHVGPNDRVTGAAAGDSAPREIRYDWLRTVLELAGNKSNAAPPAVIHVLPSSNPGSRSAAEDKPPTTDTLLAEAMQRLKNDAQQASAPASATPNDAAERQTLNHILAAPVYKTVSDVSATERLREWLYYQLDKLLASLIRFGARSPWIVWALRILLLLGIGVGLVWAFLRIERGARVKLVPDVVPAPDAPSARDWQLWLGDAQAMAAKGEWREAIHFVYWASIARLESRRLWPADRARTPREYLGLVPAADPRKPTLAALTQSFERTWYGGRAAASADFNTAMEQAAALGVKAE
jgi:hypothetical protein